MNINWLPIFGARIGFKKAEKEIPQVAREFGLEYKQSEYLNILGSIKGNFKGYNIEIVLKEQTIRIYFKKGPYQNLYLSNEKSKKRNSSNTKTDDKQFNKYFKTQNLTAKFKKKINEDNEVKKSFKNLTSLRIKSLTVNEKCVYLKYSNPGFSRNYGRDMNNPHTTGYMVTDYVYIPVTYIRKVIPLLTDWLDLLENK